MDKDSFDSLKEFSQEIINMGKSIEENLQKKQELEAKIQWKTGLAKKLQEEIFSLKSDLTKIDLDLGKLEKRGAEIQKKGNKND